jgi:hypothetical protein
MKGHNGKKTRNVPARHTVHLQNEFFEILHPHTKTPVSFSYTSHSDNDDQEQRCRPAFSHGSSSIKSATKGSSIKIQGYLKFSIVLPLIYATATSRIPAKCAKKVR